MKKYGEYLEESFAKEVLKSGDSKGVVKQKRNKLGITITTTVLEENNIFRRSAGEYLTVSVPNFIDNNIESVIKILSKAVRKMLNGVTKILIVGMGNEYILSDSLGILSVRKIKPNKVNNETAFAKFCPSVAGNTGIESYNLIKAIKEEYKPDCIIAIDSLCTKNIERVGCSFQITNAGIVPGSAVGNYECNLTKECIGVNVIAIGVPLVVDLYSLVKNYLQNIKPLNQSDLKALSKLLAGEIYSPKDIDYYVDVCSSIIASVINNVIN